MLHRGTAPRVSLHAWRYTYTSGPISRAFVVRGSQVRSPSRRSTLCWSCGLLGTPSRALRLASKWLQRTNLCYSAGRQEGHCLAIVCCCSLRLLSCHSDRAKGHQCEHANRGNADAGHTDTPTCRGTRGFYIDAWTVCRKASLPIVLYMTHQIDADPKSAPHYSNGGPLCALY